MAWSVDGVPVTDTEFTNTMIARGVVHESCRGIPPEEWWDVELQQPKVDAAVAAYTCAICGEKRLDSIRRPSFHFLPTFFREVMTQEEAAHYRASLEAGHGKMCEPCIASISGRPGASGVYWERESVKLTGHS